MGKFWQIFEHTGCGEFNNLMNFLLSLQVWIRSHMNPDGNLLCKEICSLRLILMFFFLHLCRYTRKFRLWLLMAWVGCFHIRLLDSRPEWDGHYLPLEISLPRILCWLAWYPSAFACICSCLCSAALHRLIHCAKVKSRSTSFPVLYSLYYLYFYQISLISIVSVTISIN